MKYETTSKNWQAAPQTTRFFKLLVITILFLTGLVSLTLPVYSQSIPTLDGFIDSVYYSHGYSIDYEGFWASANATLYVLDNTSIDPDYVWICWEISRDFNDASYGANKHSTWTGGHLFFDLYESDKQRLDIENSCGELVFDATMDLLDENAVYATPSGYEAAFNATEDSDQLYISTGDWNDVDYDTSLAGDLNDLGYCIAGDCTAGGTDLLVDSPPWLDDPSYTPTAYYSDWEYSLIWEVRIARDVFQTATCPTGTLLGIATNPVELHASPSKIGVSPVTLFKAASTIGDYVWYDADRDGVQDMTEKGIANVTVALYSDPNGDGDPSDGSVIATTTTGRNGKYIFRNLGSGNYVVDVTDDHGVLTDFALTTGSTDPHGTIDLGIGERYLTADFGYAPTGTTLGSVGDFVWSDADNDGMQDQGEPGIGGVTIALYADIDGDGTFSDVVATTTTADDGSYLFDNLSPGYYQVGVTDTYGVLSGYTLSVGPQSSTDPSIVIGVTGGNSYLNADFGYYNSSLGTIGNQIWFEVDGDGVYDSSDPAEMPIPDVTLDLIKDTNGNGVWDTGEMVIASTNAVDGSYQFSGLALDDGDGDADYLIHVTDINDQLRRFRLSVGPTPGANNNSQDVYYHIELSSGSTSNQTADFGYYFDKIGGLVGDRVWYDLDGDGVQDVGEPGIANVEVQLWKMKNGNLDVQLGQIYTDANGHYYFPNLDVGANASKGPQYAVVVTADNFLAGGALEGYTPTNQADNQDESVLLTSVVNEDLTLDFGYRHDAVSTYSVGDYVWWDSNSDGVQDATETGFENVTVVIIQDLDGDGIIDDGEPVIAEDITDSNGNYLFSGIANDDYIVNITDEYGILSGYNLTTGNQPWAITVNNADILSVDFGYNLDSPTYAFISPFQVYTSAAGTVVHWETSSENGTVGFNLYRWDEKIKKFQRLNAEILPGLPGAPQGGIYRYIDNGISSNGTYTYQLEEIEAAGTKRLYGPFKVTIGAEPLDYNKPALEHMLSRFQRIPHPVTYQQQQRLQANRQAMALAQMQVQSQAGQDMKIVVKEEGLYYINAARIADTMGIQVDKAAHHIANHNFQLFNRGLEVTWFPTDDNFGIIFYGQPIDSVYTAENIYWLKKGTGQLASTVDGGSPLAIRKKDTFKDKLHLEIDKYALTALFEDAGDDFWLWDYVRGGKPGKTFFFELQGGAPEDQAELVVHLQGASDTEANPDHHVKVSLNGTYLGSSQWDGKKKEKIKLYFDQSLLVDGQNVIEVKGELDDGVPYSTFYVDSFDLTYRRYYRAVKDRFKGSGQGNKVITIEGFSSPDVRVFDITNPWQTKLLTGVTVETDNTVSFKPAGDKNIYLAATTAGLTVPFNVTADNPTRLKNKANSADYILIHAAGMDKGAHRLARVHQRNGLETMIVQVDDIYDEFSYGIVDPAAIHAFLDYAYHKWNGNRPQYVVLAGEGTYDFKNVSGLGGNLIPPLMVATPDGLFASDAILGDVDGNDGVPEIAVGRIPVMDVVELMTYAEKVENYEGSGGDWTGRVLMLADDPDDAGEFPTDSDNLSRLLPGYHVKKIYLPNYSSVDQARNETIQAINNGVVLVNYIGHGGLRNLAQENLFKTDDIRALHNQDRLPFITAMTCGVGRFEIPGFDSLSEQLVMREDGGAIAMWASGGLSMNQNAKFLASELFKTAFQGHKTTIGKAVLQAMRTYYTYGGSAFMLKIYNILGDPAIKIK